MFDTAFYKTIYRAQFNLEHPDCVSPMELRLSAALMDVFDEMEDAQLRIERTLEICDAVEQPENNEESADYVCDEITGKIIACVDTRNIRQALQKDVSSYTEPCTTKEPSEIIRGIGTRFQEMGTEGPLWTISQGNGYVGMVVVKDGDYLTVYHETEPNTIVWQGNVLLSGDFRGGPEDGYGKPLNLPYGQWAYYFDNKFPMEIKRYS